MWALGIFAVTYIGVALGRIPGLMLDRNGIALLGAIAMIVSGTVLLGQAVASIDFPTILLLYALMIVSAQLRLGGFTRARPRPWRPYAADPGYSCWPACWSAPSCRPFWPMTSSAWPLPPFWP
jgi:hypothetical protein